MGQLEDLRAFVAIVENESIGKAAKLSRIAKSAMSRRLRILEDRLQTVLITRTTRQWEITEAGRQYYSKALDIVAAIDDADANIKHEKYDLRGDIRLSVPMHFGTHVLAPHLLDFADLHESIRLNVDFGDRFVDLIGEHYDFAVRIGRLPDSSLIVKKLCETQKIVCASPEYLSSHSRIALPEHLKSHKILQFGYTHRFAWELAKSSATTSNVKLKARLNSDCGEFLVAAAENGHGVTLIPDFLAQSAIKAGTLKEILRSFRPEPLGVYMVYPASRHLPKRVRALLNYLAARLRHS